MSADTEVENILSVTPGPEVANPRPEPELQNFTLAPNLVEPQGCYDLGSRPKLMTTKELWLQQRCAAMPTNSLTAIMEENTSQLSVASVCQQQVTGILVAKVHG